MNNRAITQKQAGVSLIEVLISVLLMSFALLGLAALQAQSISQQVGATNRGNISTLIADIADRLRSNLTRAPGYDPVLGTSTFSLTSNWATQATQPSAPTKNCQTTVCTTAELSDYDMTVWRRKVRQELPQGSALVQGDVQNGVSITLMWYDKDFRSGDTLNQSATCSNTMSGGAAQTCCPSIASAPAGVRCSNTTLAP